MNFSTIIGISIIKRIIPNQKKKKIKPIDTAIPIIIDIRQPIKITLQSFNELYQLFLLFLMRKVILLFVGYDKKSMLISYITALFSHDFIHFFKFLYCSFIFNI